MGRHILSKIFPSLLALISTGHNTLAGGIENSTPTTALLFEQGTYAEISAVRVLSSVEGRLGATQISNVAEPFNLLGGGIKTDINDRFVIAFRVRQPVSVNVAYPLNPALGPVSGLSADINADALELLGRYKLDQNLSIYGGLRYQTLKGRLFFGPGPTVFNAHKKLGFSVGAAYEVPRRKLRASLTYRSQISHNLDTTSALPGITTATATTPRSLAFDFQTAIAPKTLAFAGMRWTDASDANLRIDNSVLGNVVTTDFKDTWRFNAAIARRVNKKLSLRLGGSYETGNGQPSGNIFPTNGRFGLSLSARVDLIPKFSITGTVRHIWLGDATAVSGARFENNRTLVGSLKLSTRF